MPPGESGRFLRLPCLRNGWDGMAAVVGVVSVAGGAGEAAGVQRGACGGFGGVGGASAACVYCPICGAFGFFVGGFGAGCGVADGNLVYGLLDAVAPVLTVGAMMQWGGVFQVGMANRSSRQNVPRRLDSLYHHGDIASFLRSQKGPMRAGVSDAEISYDFGDWPGIRTEPGFSGSVRTSLLELDTWRPRMGDLPGLNFYVGAQAARGEVRLERSYESTSVGSRAKLGAGCVAAAGDGVSAGDGVEG